MAKRITVVVSQGQSLNPAKRKLEEDLVAALVVQGGVDVTVVPNLYDLAPDGTGMLCLQGIAGDMIVLAWLYPRAARWILDRNGIHGQEGATLLKAAGEGEDDEDDDADEADADAEAKERVIDRRDMPKRKIYCLDLRAHAVPDPYVAEIRRIAGEATTQTVELMGWIGGAPRQDQLERYLDPAGTHHAASPGADSSAAGPIGITGDTATDLPASSGPTIVAEEPARRWYPVIDYSRCTNCMECIDFCLFGVYGVDKVDTILVEQPDNCRKGCPACSRVCPENAIIFPQHKTPAIAGSAEAAGGLKIDLSLLFGGGDGRDALSTAVSERDEQLLLAGREAVGAAVGMPKRQEGKPRQPKDDLDELIDALDDF
jgi:NAD-dependent dihydropyrimidine dehydrogenase PreA subunit